MKKLSICIAVITFAASATTANAGCPAEAIEATLVLNYGNETPCTVVQKGYDTAEEAAEIAVLASGPNGILDGKSYTIHRGPLGGWRIYYH
jgi:hypothetical protein